MRNIRVNTVLDFDDNKEKDIIDFVNELNKRHKFGMFITALIRIAYDSSNGALNRTFIEQLDSIGLSVERKEFFADVSKKVNDMESRVNAIYNMVFKIYALSLLPSKIGIKQKAENSLLAEFVIEKQLSELREILGIRNIMSVYTSNRLCDKKKEAEELLDYIIEKYSDIINVLKDELQPRVVLSNSSEETYNKIEDSVEENSDTESHEVEIFNKSDIGNVNDTYNEQVINITEPEIEHNENEVNEEENKNEGVNSTSVNEFNMNDSALMQKLFEMQQMLMQQMAQNTNTQNTNTQNTNTKNTNTKNTVKNTDSTMISVDDSEKESILSLMDI